MIPIFILWALTSLANGSIEINSTTTCDLGARSQAEQLAGEYLNAEDVRCSELAEGESRLVPGDGYYDGERLVKRLAGNRYQVMVNLNFVTVSGSMTPKLMLQRVQGCLAQAAPALRGPGGAMMEIIPLTESLMHDIPASLRPKPAPAISIVDNDPQAFSTQYPSDISCSTIIHEVLHILGLADEYDPSKRPEVAQISCRNAPAVPFSVMDNHNIATERAIPYQINCDCSTPPCSTIMRGGTRNERAIYMSASYRMIASQDFISANCTVRPLPATQNLSAPDMAITAFSESENTITFENRVFVRRRAGFELERTSISCTCSSEAYECAHNKRLLRQAAVKNRGLAQCPWGTGSSEGALIPGDHESLSGNVLHLLTTPRDDSLLHPNQFERVMKGNCPGGSRNYKTCADMSYTSSTSSNGPACNPEVREKCQSPAFFLGVSH